MREKSATKSSSSVRVAVRIRPQSVHERVQNVPQCLTVAHGKPQLTIGREKTFTYDYVFDQQTPQEIVYEKCVEELVESSFDGYNATVFAYGQTGSGKTYTMGTSFEPDQMNTGIIPRAVEQLFDGIYERRETARRAGKVIPSFEVSVQFIELYNEELIDLLSSDSDCSAAITIHEDPVRHEIYLRGVSSRNVTSPEDILAVLEAGALSRTTAATNMNQQSSRSHAIFTVNIKQIRAVPVDDDFHYRDDDGVCAVKRANNETELETLQAKFHFVDLAGSERLKRTGATGDRAKEGISINSDLLALGNVISALGGATKGRVGHVPYRDSKLTRLLQDSLGGNSRTLMIACASPNEPDQAETFSTLNYANRAKNIKNRAVVNQIQQGAGGLIDVANFAYSQEEWEAWNNELNMHLSPKFVVPEEDAFAIPLPPLGAPDDIEAIAKARAQFTKQLERFRGFEEAAEQNAKILEAKLKQRLCTADLDRERVLLLEEELNKVKSEMSNQSRENRQLKRKYAALETRVHVYETELENGRQQIERAKRYIDQEREPEKNARRTLVKLAEMFESPIPTTSNVARLCKKFGNDEGDQKENEF
uniref:Kinesin-like protein n=1 Tax=Globodera rostochiensis TaxID=31243 RepID=A0A914HRL1_GLORO